MKKVFTLGLCVFLSIALFAQKENNYTEILEAMKHSTPHVIEKDNSLNLNFLKKQWSIKKGDEILIFLPSMGKADYMFIKKKQGLLNKKLIGQVADIVGTGAMAVGVGSNNLDVITGAIEVMNKADAVSYGVDALDKIEDLNISKGAKKIAGKKAKVLKWSVVDDDYVVYVKIGKKKYEINYTGAILTDEIKIEPQNI